MKFIFLFIIISSIYSCSKPKAVFICGDHVCINGSEAEQYFEDNLTLEVKKILNTKEVTKKNINKSFKNTPNNTVKKIVNKKPKEIVDICAILKKCSIDEISRYLIKKGKAAKFPDITKRE